MATKVETREVLPEIELEAQPRESTQSVALSTTPWFLRSNRGFFVAVACIIGLVCAMVYYYIQHRRDAAQQGQQSVAVIGACSGNQHWMAQGINADVTMATQQPKATTQVEDNKIVEPGGSVAQQAINRRIFLPTAVLPKTDSKRKLRKQSEKLMQRPPQRQQKPLLQPRQ